MESKPRGYWTYERCKEVAANCSSRRDFKDKYSTAYDVARRKGWLGDFDCVYKPKEKKKDNDPRLIYAYEDKENNWVYVGLTKELKERDYYHRNGQIKKGVRKYDVVWKHFNDVGKPIPEPKVRMEDLTTQEARYYEDWYKKAYQRAGWNTGNKAKTGEYSSSTGGIGKWTYEACKAEAAKYSRRIDFQHNKGAYTASLKNGWLDDWFYKKRWTYEDCQEEAKKYSSRDKFRIGNPSAYYASVKRGWLDDWFEKPKRWTYETCKAEAAKYTGRGDFREKSSGAYCAALRNNWLDDFFGGSDKKQRGYWTYETCKAEASKYSSRGDFSECAPRAYEVSRRNNWLNDFFPQAA